MNLATRLAAAAVVTLSSIPALFAAERPRIEVQQFTLGNGMRWLLFERHDSPVVAAGWVAHVGSVNEREGITGISHLFEHMMFKGTRTIGTRNLELDLKLIDEQEGVREGMRAEMKEMRDRLRHGDIQDLTRPENQTERYRELSRQFDQLVKQQRDVIIKDQLDQIYTREGGEQLNAGTTEDLTLYFVQVPANRIELWAWLESDRLLNPVFREFYSERDVVHEERRMRTDSTPLGKFDEEFNALFWEASPYKWPTLGWPSDIQNITKPQADEYFSIYYAPNNITGVMVGDFKTTEARPIIERYFGRIPRGKKEPPEVVTAEPEHLAEKRFDAEAETSPTVRIWWQGVPFVHKDRTPLDLLTDLFSGRTGRLYKGLVLGRQVANQCSASIDIKKYEGVIETECVVKEGKDPAAVENAVYEEIARLQKEGVPEREMQKVKNEAKANAYRRLSSPFFIAQQLMFYDGLGDWQYINKYADEVEATTAADVQRVANQYFKKEHRAVGIFLRKVEGGMVDSNLAALSPQAQSMARQGLQRIQAESDPAKLREMIARLQQMAAQAPEEAKPAVALMLKRAQERLAALEAKK